MTTDNTAHPAPTPAPVAVPEFEIAFRFQDGEVFRIDDLRMGRGLFNDEVPAIVGRRDSDEDWVELGEEFRTEYDGPPSAPRPEPFVAPLPSEAVETPLQALAGSVLHDYDHDRWITHSDLATKVRALADHVLRLVPADDEDTVRLAARNLIEAYDDTAPDWYPAAIDDLREALGGPR